MQTNHTNNYEIEVTPFHKKVMLAKLTMRRVRMSYSDTALAEQARNTFDDQGIVISTHLFKEPGNPVRAMLTTYNQIYAQHRAKSFPYIDKGPRLVPKHKYNEYTTSMREAIASLNVTLERLEPIYNNCITNDIAFRSRFNGKVIDPAEYPTYEALLQGTSYDLSMRPMPEEANFLSDVTDVDREYFRAEQQRVQELVRQDTVERLITPLTHLIEKLAVPIGESEETDDGKKVRKGIFRASTLDNVTAAIAQVKDMHLEGAGFERILNELESKFRRYEEHPEYLRESPFERQQAAQSLQEITERLSVYDF